jgi:hypothetical protein
MARCAVAGAAVLAACGGAERTVHFAELEDGAIIRGEQITTIAADDGLFVTGTELFVDGGLVASDDLAPFELRWDTTQFDEAPHRVRLRARLDDGRLVEDEVRITIDNTPPTLGPIPASLVWGAVVDVDARDNLGVDRVEVVAPLLAEPLVLRPRAGRPLQFPWPGGCGPTQVTIRAFDLAGGMVERVSQVQSADGRDSDCDGHLGLLSASGDDCDDQASWVHPGAPEPPEGFDLNCDGAVARLAGVDSDGDGVASVTDGGDDCDDTDPAIHGQHLALVERRLMRAGLPLQWGRGEALVSDFGASWRLLLNRAGTVESIGPSSGDEVEVEEVAAGANPGSVGGGSGLVAFGRGNDVILLARPGTSWLPRGRIEGDAPVGKLAVELGTSLHVVYQAGTRVWIAVERGDGTWKIGRAHV